MCDFAVARRTLAHVLVPRAPACVFVEPRGGVHALCPANKIATVVDVVPRRVYLPLVMKGL